MERYHYFERIDSVFQNVQKASLIDAFLCFCFLGINFTLLGWKTWYCSMIYQVKRSY